MVWISTEIHATWIEKYQVNVNYFISDYVVDGQNGLGFDKDPCNLYWKKSS